MVSFSPSYKRSQGSPPGAEGDPMRGFSHSVTPLAFPAAPRRDRTPSDLARMIESEIIPRLMMAHRPEGASPVIAPREATVGPRTMETFVRMAITKEADVLVAFVESILEGGLTLQDVYVDLLAPTARRLGDDWTADVVSFTDVTIGLSRLQQVVRALSWKFPPREVDDDARAACFVACEGEQHTFGLFLLEDEFRRAGWRTCLDTTAGAGDAAATVREDWFDVFGLSATTDTRPELISRTIAQVRAASSNPNLFVMVGGRLFGDAPDLAAQVGADAASTSCSQALLIADDAVRPSAFG